MNKKITLIITLAAAVSIYTGCGKKDVKSVSGIAKLVTGDVTLVSGEKSHNLIQGETIKTGDRIVTGADGVAIIDIAEGLAIAEIQNNADFKITSLAGNSSNMQVDQGNIWLNVVKKLVKGESVSLKTKTTLAAVRGTKFYSFAFGEYQATCYCEGQVNLTGVESSFSGNMKQDYISYTKNGKTIFLTPEETKFMTGGGHNHSMLDKSPLGKKACNADPVIMKKVIAMVEKKFAAAK